MKYKNLKYFLAVCEQRNFTQAARLCGVTQPTLTNSIRRLEEVIGAPLFLRIRGANDQTRPTDLAIAIRPCFQRALSAMDDAIIIAKQHRSNGLYGASIVSIV